MNSPKGKEVFINPGFSKSGTTSFQYALSNMKSIYSVGNPVKKEHDYFKKIILGKYFPLDYAIFEKEWLKITDGVDKKILLSHESICAMVFRNEKFLEIIQRLIPNGKIIFTIRDQREAIKALYRNHGILNVNLPRPLNHIKANFNNWFEYCKKNINANFLGVIDYNRMISFWEKFYPKENILVLPLENFTKDKDSYIRKITSFMDIEFNDLKKFFDKPKNTAYSTKRIIYIQLRRMLNLENVPISNYVPFGKILSKKIMPFIFSGKKMDVNLNKQTIDYLINLYSSGNNSLNKRYNLELEKLNYPL